MLLDKEYLLILHMFSKNMYNYNKNLIINFIILFALYNQSPKVEGMLIYFCLKC